MHKKIQEFAMKNNLRISKHAVYGEIEGIVLSIIASGQFFILDFNMTSSDPDTDVRIKEVMIQNKKLFNVANVKKTKTSSFEVLVTANKKLYKDDNLDFLVKLFLKTAKDFGAVPSTICSVCSGSANSYIFHSGKASCMCANCQNELGQRVQNSSGSPASYISGLFGALVGAVIGAIPWFLSIYFLQLYVGYLAILIGFCSFYGYKLLRGPRKKVVANTIISVTSFIVIILSNFVYLGVQMAQDGFDVSIGLIIELIQYYPAEVMQDLLFPVVFGLIGVIAVFGLTRSYTIDEPPVVIK